MQQNEAFFSKFPYAKWSLGAENEYPKTHLSKQIEMNTDRNSKVPKKRYINEGGGIIETNDSH